MGTRGAFGVIIGEKEKIGYNQYDSYPSGNGVENLQWLREEYAKDPALSEVRRLATAARLVDDDSSPTPEDVANLRSTTNLGVSEQSTDDWYCLTREAHGSIPAMLNCGYILDGHDFPLDSLFCEWAYIIDLDANTFEVYVGFQKKEHNQGRFASDVPNDDGYYPVRLVATWSLDALPTDDEFLAFEREEAEV